VRDVVVIGAGQAGLATAYYLRRAGLDVEVLEREPAVGASWARRWDSLRLFTPARYDSLPGLPFPGAPWSHPGKDDVAAYLADYAARFELPVRTGAEVVDLSGTAGAFTLGLADGGTILGRRAIVATGGFGRPWRPAAAAGLEPGVPQLHTHDYRNPGQLPAGTVLVVGGGNSGFQVALELATHGHRVHLSEGTRLRTVPQRVAGRDLFWWLSATRAVHAPVTTAVGRRLRAGEAVIGTTRSTLRRAGVTFRPRVTATAGPAVTFADGSSLTPDAVVWATGYRHDDRWISVPGALEDGELITDGAATPVPGLYAVGRPWQTSRGSALLGYVRHDAERLARTLRAQACPLAAA
jgi:putative flavoprotein involved in K+ transport